MPAQRTSISRRVKTEAKLNKESHAIAEINKKVELMLTTINATSRAVDDYALKIQRIPSSVSDFDVGSILDFHQETRTSMMKIVVEVLHYNRTSQTLAEAKKCLKFHKDMENSAFSLAISMCNFYKRYINS